MDSDGSRGLRGSTGHSELLKSEWTVYILELNDSTYYTGITNNLSKRLAVHRSGRGSKYVRPRLPFRVVYVEYTTDRSSATKREITIKKMSKSNKERLMKNGDDNKILVVCEHCYTSLVLDKESCPKEFRIECICNNLIDYKE
jgi:putative endonuclease